MCVDSVNSVHRVFRYLYVYIYICVCAYRSGSCAYLPTWQRDCSNPPQNVGVFGSNGPFLNYVLGTGLMNMFLWTVG